ncbi:hypothetical protein AMATHDRAFT_88089 [Amanita thiersii Skay4041]|uniref:Uncharacterized protein n=1 Tax=Amanita thiersii Skay4041 TaxID=703135 RepID=A0A2A9N841_9AGAR|nr:hypothetical protein AMATHDRAFT_88089 [Amanita thiersii Skay4041]
MPLKTVRYTIHNAVDLPFDLSPKPVYNKTTDKDAEWTIEALPNGRFKMYSKGDPTGIRGNGMMGQLVAFLIHKENAVEWSIVPVPEKEDVYTTRNASWFATKPHEHSNIDFVFTGTQDEEQAGSYGSDEYAPTHFKILPVKK